MSESNESANTSGPLAGLRILDLTTMASGPLATSILGDQGAEVIKIEAPGGGDGLRGIGPSRGGLSALFCSLNRNKRGLVLDLRDPRGVKILDRLVERADVFIQNFRPGAVDRMGIGPTRYCGLHPKLIYVSVSGFGEVGPMAGRAVYDSIMQAYSGVAMHQADPETGEACFVRSVVCDKGTAIQTSQLVTAALLARERGHGGQHIKVSMLHASLAFLWPDGMQNHTLLGPGVSAPLTKGALPSIRTTRDGQIAISFIQDHEFKGFCRALELPELAADVRFSSAGPRARNLGELQGVVNPVLSTMTTSELSEKLSRESVPFAPLGDPATIHEDPQVIANNLILELEHPAAGHLRQPRPLGDFDGTPCSVPAPAPSLGQHSREIMREAGFPNDAITVFEDAGVIA